MNEKPEEGSGVVHDLAAYVARKRDEAGANITADPAKIPADDLSERFKQFFNENYDKPGDAIRKAYAAMFPTDVGDDFPYLTVVMFRDSPSGSVHGAPWFTFVLHFYTRDYAESWCHTIVGLKPRVVAVLLDMKTGVAVKDWTRGNLTEFEADQVWDRAYHKMTAKGRTMADIQGWDPKLMRFPRQRGPR